MKSVLKLIQYIYVLTLISIDFIYSGCCCKKKPSNNGSKTNLPGKPSSGPGRPSTPVFDTVFSRYLERLASVVDGYIKVKIANSKFKVTCRPFGSNGRIYIEFGKFQAYSVEIKNVNEFDVSDLNSAKNLVFGLTIGSFVGGSNYNFEDGKITLQALCEHINTLNSKDSGVYVENTNTHYLKVSVHEPRDKPCVYSTKYIDLSNGALYTIMYNDQSDDMRDMLRYRCFGLIEEGEGKGQKMFVTSLIGYVNDPTGKLGEYKYTPSGKSCGITQEDFRNFLTTDKNLTEAKNIASLSIKFE